MIRGWYSKPTIRSWLGNCRMSGTKPNSPKGNTMKKLIAPALATLIAISAFTACTTAPETAARPAVTTTADRCEEDMPCWECSENDDACGQTDDAVEAWRQFDLQGGAARLVVEEPSRPYRVDYMASTPDYPQNTDKYDLVLAGRGTWYVFRASYLDQ